MAGRKNLNQITVLVFSFLFVFSFINPALSQVKLSKSGICHDKSSSYYERTSNFKSYKTMEECLSHGRAPKGYSPGGGSASSSQISSGKSRGASSATSYDRSYFGGWADLDRDCMNTRHEILADLSTARVLLDDRRCSVVRGRWLDPYTDKVFLDPSGIDIDHIVPLAWAWDNGAWKWEKEKRVAFANDPVNLLAVDGPTNRQKGAKGPDEWVPPNIPYRCEYVLRFQRIAITYGLMDSPKAKSSIENAKSRHCSR